MEIVGLEEFCKTLELPIPLIHEKNFQEQREYKSKRLLSYARSNLEPISVLREECLAECSELKKIYQHDYKSVACNNQGYTCESAEDSLHINSQTCSKIHGKIKRFQSQTHQHVTDFFLWQHWIRTTTCSRTPNLLLYGFGSKQSILEDFVHSSLGFSIPLVAQFYGLHPRANFVRFLRRILEDLFSDQLERSNTSRLKNAALLQQAISKALRSQRGDRKCRQQRFSAFLASVAFGATSPTRKQQMRKTEKASCLGFLHFTLCIVIHNIDSPHLRAYQSVLADLAMDSKILLVASADHMRFPLLWDFNQLSKFQFLYLHVPSGENYRQEIEWGWGGNSPQWLNASFEKQSLSPESVQNVLAVMPHKHMQLFEEIGKLAYTESLRKQMDNQESLLSVQIPRESIFKKSQQNMLYVDMTRFNAAIEEFLDHRLLVQVSCQERKPLESLCVKESDYDNTALCLPLSRESLIVLFPQICEAQQDEDEDEDE